MTHAIAKGRNHVLIECAKESFNRFKMKIELE